MASNYTSTNDAYYKVSFITTHSNNIPKKMKQTGALIVMDNVDTTRKSLWFRGDLIASGYGFVSEDEMATSTYFIENIENIFGENGIYDFIQGYVGKDVDGNEIHGQSLSYRFTYIDETFHTVYNDLSTYIENTYNTLYTYTTNCYQANWSYTAEAYRYLNSVYSYINNEIQRSYQWTNDVYTYASSCYTYLLNTYSYTLDYIANSYQTGWETDQAIYSYFQDKTYYIKNYIDQSVYALVGGAPETLDTLAEIAYALKNAQQWGLDNEERIANILNNYVTHYEVVGKTDEFIGYSYIHDYAFYTEREECTGYMLIEDGQKYFEDPAEWDSIQNAWHDCSSIEDQQQFIDNYGEKYGNTDIVTTYTYYLYKDSIENGYIALKDNQVSCTGQFQNTQLSYLLSKILPPYHYNIPTVKVNEKWLKENNQRIREYGSSENLSIYLDICPNDSDCMGNNTLKIIYNDDITASFGFDEYTLEYYNGISEGTYSKTSYYKIFDPVPFNLENSIFNDNSLTFTLSDNCVVKYNQSFNRIYPEIQDFLLIEDTEHAFGAGQFKQDIFKDIKIPIRYKLFYGIGDEMILNNSTNWKYINSQITKSEIFENIDPITDVYIAIPKNLTTGQIISIKIENFETGICKEIYNTRISNSEQFEITSELGNYTPSGVTNYLEYVVYKYHSKLYNIDYPIRFIVEVSDEFTDLLKY